MRLQLLPRDKRISQYRVTSVCKVVTSGSSTLRGSFIPHEHCQGQPPFETFRPFLFLPLIHPLLARLGSSKNRGLSTTARPITVTRFASSSSSSYSFSSAHQNKIFSGYGIYHRSNDRSLWDIELHSFFFHSNTIPSLGFCFHDVFSENSFSRDIFLLNI